LSKRSVDPDFFGAPLNFSEKRSRVYPAVPRSSFDGTGVKPVRFLFNWDEFNLGPLTQCIIFGDILDILG